MHKLHYKSNVGPHFDLLTVFPSCMIFHHSHLLRMKGGDPIYRLSHSFITHLMKCSMNSAQFLRDDERILITGPETYGIRANQADTDPNTSALACPFVGRRQARTLWPYSAVNLPNHNSQSAYADRAIGKVPIQSVHSSVMCRRRRGKGPGDSDSVSRRLRL